MFNSSPFRHLIILYSDLILPAKVEIISESAKL